MCELDVPDVVLGRGLLDNTLVTGRAASLGTRVGSESTAGGDGSAGLVDESIFIEGSDGGVRDLARGGELADGRGSGENESASYNGDTVVVDVSSLVKLFLELSVFVVRLDTTGVQRGLVDAVGNHCEGGARVSNGRDRAARGSQAGDEGIDDGYGDDEVRGTTRTYFWAKHHG